MKKSYRATFLEPRVNLSGGIIFNKINTDQYDLHHATLPFICAWWKCDTSYCWISVKLTHVDTSYFYQILPGARHLILTILFCLRQFYHLYLAHSVCWKTDTLNGILTILVKTTPLSLQVSIKTGKFFLSKLKASLFALAYQQWTLVSDWPFSHYNDESAMFLLGLDFVTRCTLAFAQEKYLD